MNDTKEFTPPPRSDRAVAATGREHLLTVVFGLWMTVGLFLDGYFHQNLETESESFLTPWHVVFYTGFVASALWLAHVARRRARGKARPLESLPPGYEGARVGIVLFGLGAVGDAAWHTVFGVERGVDALLSPTHLVLFVALVLILTVPLRAASVAKDFPPSPWIVVCSVTSAAALVGFFLNFAWGLGISGFVRVPYDAVSEAGETEVIAGVASMLVTTIVLFGAARVMLQAGRVPVGAITVLFVTVATLVSGAFDEDAEGIVAAAVAGVALDAAVRVRRFPPHYLGIVGTAFGVTAAVLWLVYLGLLGLLGRVAWQAEIWLGAVVLNGLTAYLTAKTLPPRHDGLPVEARSHP